MFLVPLPEWWDNMTAMCHHAQHYAVLRSELKALCMRTLCIGRQLKIQDSTRWARTRPSPGKQVMELEDGWSVARSHLAQAETVLSEDLRSNSN